MGILRWVLGLSLVLVQISCSSVKSNILEPVDQAPVDAVALPSPRLEAVTQLLASLGYEGVGLEHEDEGTLSFLETVFSSPKVRNRKIQFVYTGLQLSYDKEQKSLTLGEEENVTKALKFIEKNIPTR